MADAPLTYGIVVGVLVLFAFVSFGIRAKYSKLRRGSKESTDNTEKKE